MRFYIFGVNDRKKNRPTRKRISRRKSIFSSSSLDSTYERFDRINNERIYDHLYMIVDFEISRSREMSLNELILVKSDYGLSEEVADKTMIKVEGFIRDFHNNVISLEVFLDYCERNIPVEYCVEYQEERENGMALIERKLIDTSEMKRMQFSPSRVFTLEYRNRIQSPLCNRKFHNYILESSEPLC